MVAFKMQIRSGKGFQGLPVHTVTMKEKEFFMQDYWKDVLDIQGIACGYVALSQEKGQMREKVRHHTHLALWATCSLQNL